MKGRRGNQGALEEGYRSLLGPEERQPLPPLCDHGLQGKMRKLPWRRLSWENAASVCGEAEAQGGQLLPKRRCLPVGL